MLDLLRTRAEQLRAHIAGLLSLGYKARQFTYDSTQLEATLAQIPQLFPAAPYRAAA